MPLWSRLVNVFRGDRVDSAGGRSRYEIVGFIQDARSRDPEARLSFAP
jgi:hypothetical protein